MLSRGIPRISNKSELSSIANICFNVLTFCNSKALKQGICAHSPIIKLGLEHNLLLNNNLLSVYTKCYGVEHARHLFDEMPLRDVVSWTCMISAYSKCKDHEEALQLFDFMRMDGHYPNEFTLSSVLRSCSSLGKFSLGSQLQSYMVKNGFDSNGMLASSLIDLYSTCDFIKEAYELFTNIDNADALLWTTIISAYVQAQNWKRGLQLYSDMISVGVVPNEYTFVKLLSASSFLGLYYGRSLHAQVIVRGVKTALVLKTALVDMYCKCEEMDSALKISKQTHERDVFLWTAIICGFIRMMDFIKAFAAFTEMLCSGIVPTNYTYSGILNACSSILGLELGEQIHARVLISGLENDVSVGNALVDMYMKCSYTVENALGVFKEISSPNVISWTSLVAGLAEHGFQEESLKAFEEMIYVGVQPNSFTLSSILWICSSVNSPSLTRELHGYIFKKFADQDIVVWNALVDAYAGLGMLHSAQLVIKMMAKRDVITYTGIATRMNQMGSHTTALSIISLILDDNIRMDGYSIATFLSASASLGAMEPGKQLHCSSLKSGLDSWISVSNGIVDLYGKCGCTDDAARAFYEIDQPDVASWNCLMFALAYNGHISSSLSAFEDMLLAGVRPDAITFLLLMFACSHGGLVDLGLDHFQYMKERHNIEPQLDHYVSKVDLLGRAGRLVEALGVIESMPFQPNALIYKTLLGGCRLHGNIPLGEDMARRSLELEPSDPTIYVLLANMYEDFGQPELGDKTRKLMKENGLRKTPGQSWTEVQNKIHLFSAGDKMHPRIDEIHEKLDFVVSEFKIMGYPYEANKVSMYHSEKLAVIFGLLNVPSTAPIRIIKDIRICKDCHDFMVNLTLLVHREIIVRDGKRFHSFKKGECSCRGFW